MNRMGGVAAALLCLGACDDVELGSLYDLVEVDGQSLPAAMDPGIDFSSGTLHESTLAFDRDSATTTSHVTLVGVLGDTLDVRFAYSQAYRRDGARVVLEPEDFGPSTCSVAPIYRLSDDGDELRSIGWSTSDGCEDPIAKADPGFVYRRVE